MRRGIFGLRPAGSSISICRPDLAARVDTHLTPGTMISAYYDGLLAKVISAGETREDARRRMVLALGEFWRFSA